MRMDQHHPDIDRLIGRYLSRKASPTEKEALEEWLNASPQNRETLARLEAIWGMPLSDEYSTRMEGIRDQIWAAGLGEEQSNKKQLRREVFAHKWLKIAAVLVLLLTGAWFSTVLFEEQTVMPPKTVAWTEKINHAGQRS